MKKSIKLVLCLLASGLVSCSVSNNISSKEEANSYTTSDSKGTSSDEATSSIKDITLNTSSLDNNSEEKIVWKKFKDGINNEVASTENGKTIFTSSNASYSDLLNVSLNGNSYNIAGPTNNIAPIAAKEYIYSMDIVSEGEFKMVLFATENTKMNYDANDIINNVCKKMGVYLTFKAGIVELTAALGQGTVEKSASYAVGAVSTNASLTLDGKTTNNIKVSLERSTVLNEDNKVMMKLYVNNTLITFRKLLPDNNEDNLGFSLRTEWNNGISDGVSIFSTTPSAFIRLSRGITETFGLGSGLGFVSTNKTIVSNFAVSNENNN